MVIEYQMEHNIGGQMTKGEVTGTKYCIGCIYFYHEVGSGMFCTLRKFEGQYTEDCPRYEQH